MTLELFEKMSKLWYWINEEKLKNHEWTIDDIWSYLGPDWDIGNDSKSLKSNKKEIT